MSDINELNLPTDTLDNSDHGSISKDTTTTSQFLSTEEPNDEFESGRHSNTLLGKIQSSESIILNPTTIPNFRSTSNDNGSNIISTEKREDLLTNKASSEHHQYEDDSVDRKDAETIKDFNHTKGTASLLSKSPIRSKSSIRNSTSINYEANVQQSLDFQQSQALIPPITELINANGLNWSSNSVGGIADSSNNSVLSSVEKKIAFEDDNTNLVGRCEEIQEDVDIFLHDGSSNTTTTNSVDKLDNYKETNQSDLKENIEQQQQPEQQEEEEEEEKQSNRKFNEKIKWITKDKSCSTNFKYDASLNLLLGKTTNAIEFHIINPLSHEIFPPKLSPEKILIPTITSETRSSSSSNIKTTSLSSIRSNLHEIYNNLSSQHVYLINELYDSSLNLRVEELFYCAGCLQLAINPRKRCSLKELHFKKGLDKTCKQFQEVHSKGYIVLKNSSDSGCNNSYLVLVQNKKIGDVSSQELLNDKSPPLKKRPRSTTIMRSRQLFKSPTKNPIKIDDDDDDDDDIVELQVITKKSKLNLSGELMLRGVTADLPRLRPHPKISTNIEGNNKPDIKSYSDAIAKNENDFCSQQNQKLSVPTYRTTRSTTTRNLRNSKKDDNSKENTLIKSTNSTKSVKSTKNSSIFKQTQAQIIGYKPFKFTPTLLIIDPIELYLRDINDCYINVVKLEEIDQICGFFNLTGGSTELIQRLSNADSNLNVDSSIIDNKFKSFLRKNRYKSFEFILKRHNDCDEQGVFILDEFKDLELIEDLYSDQNGEKWEYVSSDFPGLKF